MKRIKGPLTQNEITNKNRNKQKGKKGNLKGIAYKIMTFRSCV